MITFNELTVELDIGKQTLNRPEFHTAFNTVWQLVHHWRSSLQTMRRLPVITEVLFQQDAARNSRA